MMAKGKGEAEAKSPPSLVITNVAIALKNPKISIPLKVSWQREALQTGSFSNTHPGICKYLPKCTQKG